MASFDSSHDTSAAMPDQETVDSFDEMALKKELLHGIYSYGYERPSAVQQRVIMPVIKGKRRDGGDEQAAHI
jgi:superfamily II DNA/RNA helicase